MLAAREGIAPSLAYNEINGRWPSRPARSSTNADSSAEAELARTLAKRRYMPSNDDGGLNKGLTNYGDIDFSLFLRKAFIKGAGYSDDALSRPIVGIVNTGSGYNACHGNAPQLIEAVKRGVMLAGGIAVEFPTISLHESFAHPTSMYLRNLMSD